MHDREQASDIEDVATAWAAKAERGLTTAERADLDLWLEGDNRRLGAYVRAQAAWIHAERAAALGAMPEPPDRSPEHPAADFTDVSDVKRRGISRRIMLGGGGALAASMAAAYYLGVDRYRTIESGLGEIRHIGLNSRATLTLDTDSRVDIELSSNDTRMKLVRGRMFLDVALKQALPLTIGIGDLILTTVDAAFSIQSLANNSIVAFVTKGTLLASQSQGLLAMPRQVTIESGQALMLPFDELVRSSDVRTIDSVQREQLLAWRDGMLSFGGEELAKAVRAFDRYNAVRIEVPDPALARQRVTGLFKANDPQGFASAIAASFGGVATETGNIIRISAKSLPAA